MTKHSRQHAFHHRQRTIARWKFIYRNVFYSPPDLGSDWWDGENRLANGMECGCRTCRFANWSEKFRQRKHAFYRMLDRIEGAA